MLPKIIFSHPGTGIHLLYHSARSPGYLSTIQLQLTPDSPSSVPRSLSKVHLKITIEGVVHERVFEADPGIQYTYAWDRLNEYRQVSTCPNRTRMSGL